MLPPGTSVLPVMAQMALMACALGMPQTAWSMGRPHWMVDGQFVA